MNALLSNHDVLTQPVYGSHLVHTSADEESLIDGVCKFMGAGLRQDEAAVAIATSVHIKELQRKLQQNSMDTDAVIASGQLKLLDADELLATFMIDGSPDWALFESVASKIIDDSKIRHKKIRLYGEMVNILWQREEFRSAIVLEGFWNKLAKSHAFTLLCGYSIDNLSQEAYEGPLQCVCSAHTHFIPGQESALLEKAVTKAGQDILGPDYSKLLHTLKSRHYYESTHMPPAQATLLFLRETMPQIAVQVLNQVRSVINQKT